MVEIAECHCECGWSGYYDDCRIYTEREPRGEFWGMPVSEVLYYYHCPICGKEVDAGPELEKEDEA